MARRSVLGMMALVMLTSGCASVTHQRYALTPAPNECQATETRPTWQSNIVGVVCWDAQGKPIGMGAAGGTSTAAVTTSLIGSAATVAGPVAGAAILAPKLVEAAKSVPTTLTTTTTGTVNVGTIPNVSVNPVSGTFTLVPGAP